MKKTKNLMKREALSSIALKYREHFTTITEWDKFAQENDLPTASAYRFEFGSWNEAKNIIGIKKERKKRTKYQYSITELEMIAEKHGSHMSTLAEWDQYAKKNNLPVGMTFIKNLGSEDQLAKWEDIKEKYYRTDPNAPKVSKGKFGEYTDESLIAIAKEHFDYFSTRKKWDDYVEQCKDEITLPPAFLYIEHFKTWSKAKNRVGIPNKKKQLEQTMIDHKKVFQEVKSSREWDEYATEHRLLKTSSFVYVFGSWKKAKEYSFDLFMKMNE